MPDPSQTAGSVEVPGFEFERPTPQDQPEFFEDYCKTLEDRYSLLLGCDCCVCDRNLTPPCKNCVHAIGFHTCVHHTRPPAVRWKRGTLYGGKFDAQSVIARFHKKGMRLETLRTKISEYVEANAMDKDQAEKVLALIESERGVHREGNCVGDDEIFGVDAEARTSTTGALTVRQLEDKLKERERNMQQTKHGDREADQWAVYCYIVSKLDNDDETYLRLIVQADAGAGKSYLLKALAIRCLLKKVGFECAAPTGIAAANVEVEGTDVNAVTIHKLFQMTIGADNELESRLDFDNVNDPWVERLLGAQILLLDEGPSCCDWVNAC